MEKSVYDSEFYEDDFYDDESCRYLNVLEVLEMAREKGFVLGRVVVDSHGLIKLCHRLGFDYEKVFRALGPF